VRPLRRRRCLAARSPRALSTPAPFIFQLDVVVVVLSLCFSNATEAALAKSFLQEMEISRRQAKELATAPGVSYSLAPPLELQHLAPPTGAAEPGFVGFVSLAINKRVVDGGRLEKASARPR